MVFSPTIATPLPPNTVMTHPPCPASTTVWPYPRWIAHRGAGKLAPENTLAAFQRGAHHGYRMFECDVKLSADGVPFLLHDDTLERTTNAAALWPDGTTLVAGDLAWKALSALDAGSWHSDAFAREGLPTLALVAEFCIAHGYFVNLEIKPSPGTALKTGEVVAQQAARLWQNGAVPPLLTSFKTEALQGAARAQPELPRGLLLDALWPGWLQAAIALKCVAVVFHHSLLNADTARQVKAAGLRLLSYTVNDASTAQGLIALGIDGIVTDRVDYFNPDA